MKSLSNILCLMAMMFALVTFSQSQSTAAPVQGCGCQSGACSDCNTPTYDASCVAATGKACGCRKCRLRRPAKNCPNCDCDSCILALEDVKVKKTCFKTEQKLICVPAVRLPWMKCCPPGKSKTRTINVLKVHKYECKKCTYKWSVQEPAAPQKSEPQATEYSAPAPVYSDQIQYQQQYQPQYQQQYQPPQHQQPQFQNSAPQSILPPEGEVMAPPQLPFEISTPNSTSLQGSAGH